MQVSFFNLSFLGFRNFVFMDYCALQWTLRACHFGSYSNKKTEVERQSANVSYLDSSMYIVEYSTLLGFRFSEALEASGPLAKSAVVG